MSNVYKFREGHSVKGVAAQDVGLELEAIRTRHGSLTPQSVVKEARREESPLHSCFTWNNDEASEQYRLHEARRLIVSIRIVNGPASPVVPVYVSITTPEKSREYRPTTEVMSDEKIKERFMDELRRFIETLERKYKGLRDLDDLLERMKQVAG